jgi:hypothetical protein
MKRPFIPGGLRHRRQHKVVILERFPRSREDLCGEGYPGGTKRMP